MFGFRVLKRFIRVKRYPANFLTLCDNVRVTPSRNLCVRLDIPETVEHTDLLKPVKNPDLSDYGSGLKPSFTFAGYIDKVPMLQNLLKLGLNFYEIEKKPDINFILTLKWENIEKIISFLTENGVPSDKLGDFLTKNPYILKEDLNDLEVRIQYLQLKKFNEKMISEILVKNPKWLSQSVNTIDERLGYLQSTYSFTGDQVRSVITRVPSLATVAKRKIELATFTLKVELGLDQHTFKKLILTEPVLLRKAPYDLLLTYQYLINDMEIPINLILQQPKILLSRKHQIKERHLFLKSLGRAQYSPVLPGYVPLESLITGTDEEFCENVAKTSIELYDNFLKTL